MKLPPKPNVIEYPIGSVCVVVGSYFPELIGTEVTIRRPLEVHYSKSSFEFWWGYQVDLRHYKGTKRFLIMPEHHNLRLKEHPAEDMEWAVLKLIQLLENPPPGILDDEPDEPDQPNPPGEPA